KVGVAGLQQPFIATLHGHARMAEGVAHQRYKRNVRGQSVKGTNPLQAEPVFAFAGGIDLPLLFGRPLLRTEPLPVQPSFLQESVVSLGGEHMNRRLRKVVQASGMVKIEMGENNMPDIARVET